MAEQGHTPSSTHPPLPPTAEDDQFHRLRLLRSRRVGISTYNRLLIEHGTAQKALGALPEVARAAGVRAYEICPESLILQEVQSAQAAGATLLDINTPLYPDLLRTLPDAPPFLWAIGNLSLLKRPSVSIVGARNASSLGSRMAQTLAKDLGEEGFVIVSGLARGIDTAAHQAALPYGTIAVQAGGVDVIYPAQNTALAQDIAKQGLRLSEMPMGMRPVARHFPKRNRIISGLSRASIIVEAAARSGSLITARDALDQGRDVLAVPGHPFDPRAAGCNMLIRDGAPLIRNAADVIESLSPIAPAPRNTARTPARQTETMASSAPENTTNLHSRILEQLGPSPIAEDQLMRDLQTGADLVSPALLDLELEGRILRHSGSLISRAP